MTDSQARMVVAELVHRLNQTWLNGRVGDLAAFFDPDVVLVAPGFSARLVGRTPVIDSYREFVDNATIHAFELFESTIDVFGATAVATCPWAMEYSVTGRRWKAEGHDVLVLRETDGSWRVVWRHLASGPEEEIVPVEPG